MLLIFEGGHRKGTTPLSQPRFQYTKGRQPLSGNFAKFSKIYSKWIFVIKKLFNISHSFQFEILTNLYQEIAFCIQEFDILKPDDSIFLICNICNSPFPRFFLALLIISSGATFLFSRKCHVNFRKHLVGEHTDRIIDIFREVWQIWSQNGVTPIPDVQMMSWQRLTTNCLQYFGTGPWAKTSYMQLYFLCDPVDQPQSRVKRIQFSEEAPRRGGGPLVAMAKVPFFWLSQLPKLRCLILHPLRSMSVMLLSWTTQATSRIHSSLKLPLNALRYNPGANNLY